MINTLEEVRAFMNAGDGNMDTEAFWENLGVAWEAMREYTIEASIMLGVPPAATFTLLICGARLALQGKEEL
jgi:hypothetical protein